MSHGERPDEGSGPDSPPSGSSSRMWEEVGSCASADPDPITLFPDTEIIFFPFFWSLKTAAGTLAPTAPPRGDARTTQGVRMLGGGGGGGGICCHDPLLYELQSRSRRAAVSNVADFAAV